MTKFLYAILTVLVVCISSCNKDIAKGNAEPIPQIEPSTNKLNLDIRLSGTPVVKIVSHGNQHWLMTETIDSEREEQKRAVKLISSKEPLSIHHAVSKDEYLADIAAAPEAEQLWVAVAPVENPDVFVLRLINDREILWEFSVARPDEEHKLRHGNRYPTGIEDFVRIVSDATQVFIVGRNAFGSSFLAVVKDRKLVQKPFIIGPPYGYFVLGRNGGSYSVMDQLTSQYKLLLTKCSDKIAVSWLAHSFEINRNLESFGLSQNVNYGDEYYVSVLEFEKELPLNLRAIKPTIYKVGDALLQGISCEGNDLTLSGSSRIMDNAGSAPFVIQNGKLSFFKDAFQRSASAQAVLTVDGQLIMGGSTEWSQNPNGISIDGGVGFLKIGDKIETFGEIRTEVRSISHTDGLLCYAGMIAGPTTHSHDSNPKSLVGDGFFKCRKL